MSVHSPLAIVTHTEETGHPKLLAEVAFHAIGRGDWSAARNAANSCLGQASVAQDLELMALSAAVRGIVSAIHGDDAGARQLLEHSERLARRCGGSELADVLGLARGVEALNAGRYDEAWARLAQLLYAGAGRPRWIRLVAVGFLAESGLHGGSESLSDLLVVTLDELGSTPVFRGATAFARAMSSFELPVDARFDRALAECPVERVFDRARIQLARGVTLRRERRVVESRLPLQEALVAFEGLGAVAWAEHARRELRASGARRLRRELGDAEALTAQELEIVRLAALGMTNREIGQRLYLSHRTIGSHLYRAFPKLGIAARSQLRDMLAELDALVATRAGIAH